MIDTMKLGVPGYPERGRVPRVIIQDRTDLPEHLRPALRVTDIPWSNVIEFTEETMHKWRKLFRKLLRLTGKAMTFIAIAALAKSIQAQTGLAEQHIPLVIGAISSSICSSFKPELGTATHNFTNSTGDTFKFALFTSSATLGASTTAYSTTNEIMGTGYTAGGTACASSTPTLSSTTVIYDFVDAAWTSASFTGNGGQMYNTSKSNKSIFIIAFGSDQTVTAGTFTVQWPAADASNAIIRY